MTAEKMVIPASAAQSADNGLRRSSALPSGVRPPSFPWLTNALTLIALAVMVPIAAWLWPVDFFELRGHEDGPLILSEPSLLGRSVVTEYIHSVQKTPVIDEYRIQEGRIWPWRERIMSHNAGLPALMPERGRFLYDDPWMVVQGGGVSLPTVAYRVGNAEFGRNTLSVFSRPRLDLWRDHPDRRLWFTVRRLPVFNTTVRPAHDNEPICRSISNFQPFCDKKRFLKTHLCAILNFLDDLPCSSHHLIASRAVPCYQHRGKSFKQSSKARVNEHVSILFHSRLPD